MKPAMKRVILLDIPPEDFILATRAVKWLMAQPFPGGNSGIISYGDHEPTKDFYVKRNKASITVRPCGRAAND